MYVHITLITKQTLLYPSNHPEWYSGLVDSCINLSTIAVVKLWAVESGVPASLKKSDRVGIPAGL